MEIRRKISFQVRKNFNSFIFTKCKRGQERCIDTNRKRFRNQTLVRIGNVFNASSAFAYRLDNHWVSKCETSVRLETKSNERRPEWKRLQKNLESFRENFLMHPV